VVVIAGRSCFSSGRDSIAKVLGQTFDAREIDAAKQGLGQVKDLSHSAWGKVPEIMRLRQEGKTMAEIGRRLGFNYKAIARALAKPNQQGQ
jgi:hypothetical protein